MKSRPEPAAIVSLAFLASVACSSGQTLLDTTSRGLGAASVEVDAAATDVDRLASECEKDSRGQIGWLKASATNVTPRFRKLLERVKAGENVVPPEAREYVWMLSPGLFSNLYPNYMKGNTEALRDLGLRFVEVPLTPNESVTAGARVLRDTVLAHTDAQQAVILGHSKGGVDAAAALALYPEIRSRVRSFVAIQTPYAGSPVANDLANCEMVGAVAAFAIHVLGSDPEAAMELSYPRRRRFHAKHPYPRSVRTLSLATSRVDVRSAVFLTGSYVLKRYGVESDGLVVPVDAVLPGSRVVYLDDMDHAEAVLSGVPGFINYSAKEVTQVLVAMAITP
jgi:triacylglycerol lipase